MSAESSSKDTDPLLEDCKTVSMNPGHLRDSFSLVSQLCALRGSLPQGDIPDYTSLGHMDRR